MRSVANSQPLSPPRRVSQKQIIYCCLRITQHCGANKRSCVCVLSCPVWRVSCSHPKSGEPAHIYKRAHNIQTETPPGNAPHRAAPGNRALSRRQITAGPPSNSAIPSGASPPRCALRPVPPLWSVRRDLSCTTLCYTVLYYTVHDDTPALRCGVFWAQGRGPGGEHGGEARGERRERREGTHRGAHSAADNGSHGAGMRAR